MWDAIWAKLKCSLGDILYWLQVQQWRKRESDTETDRGRMKGRQEGKRGDRGTEERQREKQGETGRQRKREKPTKNHKNYKWIELYMKRWPRNCWYGHDEGFQISNLKSALLLHQYPQWRSGSVAHRTNQCPKAKIQHSVQEHQQTIGCAGIYEVKAKPKRWVFRCLLKDAVEGADWTKTGSLLHKSGATRAKALAPVLVSALETIIWSQWTGWS